MEKNDGRAGISKGYSVESLNMLKTEEGQLNAVFACYGSAMQHGQLFEKALLDFLAKYKEWTNTELSPDELSSIEPVLDNKTIGQLLRLFDKRVSIGNKDVRTRLGDARARRNFLAHGYFVSRAKLFEIAGGRLKLLSELVSMEQEIRTAMGLVNGMRVAVEETLEGKSRDGKKSQALFTISVGLGEKKG